MKKYKVGDKVRILADGMFKGFEGVVDYVGDMTGCVWVAIIEERDCRFMAENYEVELVTNETISTTPKHYATKGNDVIQFCTDYNLNFNRGNVVKYVARAGKKDNEIEDLEKALDYLNRELVTIKNK